MNVIVSSILLVLYSISLITWHNGNSRPANKIYISDTVPVLNPVTPLIREASGIADSKINEGYLWVQEDSGNPPELCLLAHDGKVFKKIFIKNATNRDWEDMAIAGNDIYIADIGDNNQVYKSYSFYHFPEPSSSIDTVKNVSTISFQYSDGSHDAEAFIIDPESKDIFIITKRDNSSKIYNLAFPYNRLLNTALPVASLPYTGVVSAALSVDGMEILIKTYLGINLYKRNAGQSILQALQSSPIKIKYILEPQGEALCFSNNNTGFFTLSEKGIGRTVSLYFYPRK